MRDKINGVGWSLAAWGILTALFGIIVLAWPAITLKAFLLVLGIYLVVGGVALAMGSIINTKEKWAGGFVLGALNVIAGLFVLANPDISATVVLYLIAVWALLVGSVSLVGGVELGRDGVWLVVAGLASIVFGLWAFVNPEQGVLAVVWLVGVYNLVYGVLLIAASFKTKKLAKNIPSWF